MIQTAPVYSCSATHKDSALIHVKLEASLRSLLDRQYSETQLCSLLSTAHFTSALLVETYRQSELFRTTVQNENCRTTTQETYAWNISYVTPVKKRVKKGKMVPSTPWTYIGAVEMSLYSSTPLREMSGQPHAETALLWYRLNRKLEARSRSGRFGEKKNVLLLSGFQPQTVRAAA